MSSPSGRRRPLSTSGYEPLLQATGSVKPKPPPKPKPQFLKSSSATDFSSGYDSGSYFQPGGGSGIGYCLSSVYKTKKTSSEHDIGDEKNSSGKFQDAKVKFVSKDGPRPPMASLPTKFRVAFEERSRRGGDAFSEPATGVLVAIAESESSKVRRRPPPAIPRSSSQRMSNPLPTTHVHRSLSVSAQLITSSAKHSNSDSSSNSSSLQRNISNSSTRSSSVSSTMSTPTLVSPSLVKSSKGSPQPITFAQPPPREMDYTEREHSRSAFENLEKFRRKGELCDAKLIANGIEFEVHRVVLSACSPYFESMFIGEFAEPPEEPVIIDEVSDSALEILINFAYTSHIKLTERNVYSVFEAADLLQFNGVKGACFKFFKQQMNKSNCIRTWLFAVSHNCTELLDASLKYVELNFLDIVRGKEFLDLNQLDVVTGITSLEDLAITAEEQVYEAVLAWIKYNLEERKKHSLEAFKSVRFPSMSKDYLMHIVDNEVLIKEDPDLLELVSTTTVD